MKKALLLCVIVLLASCMKHGSDNGPVNDSKDGFTWSTITTKTITVNEISDVYNQDGELVGENLLPGKYIVPAGVNTAFTLRPAELSKASDNGNNRVYFPSSAQYATLMAEDNFPYMGDYDMNDVVVSFRIEYVIDPAETKKAGVPMVSDINIDVLPRALGSSYDLLGLGLNFNGDLPVIIKNFTTNHKQSPEKLFTSEECESKGRVSGVVPLSGDLRSNFSPREGMINTFNESVHRDTKVFTVKIKLDKLVELNALELFGKGENGKANMDIFVVVNSREKEIHLKDQKPTSKFNYDLFSGTNGFMTKDNYVWMMVVDKHIPYPKEVSSVEDVFPNFTQWVESNGRQRSNWYDSYDTDLIYKNSL